MTEKEKMEEKAERKLRQVVREFVEANTNVSFCSTWIYNIDGDRYHAKIFISKDEESEDKE